LQDRKSEGAGAAEGPGRLGEHGRHIDASTSKCNTDDGQSTRATSNNLEPAIGAHVEVRVQFAVDKKIMWFKAQIIDFDKTTHEWEINLDVCEDVEKRQRKCDGCRECVYQLESGTTDW